MGLKIDPNMVKKMSAGKAASVGKDFNAWLGAANAFGPMSSAVANQGGSPTAATVLSAAFSGMQTYQSHSGGGMGMSGYGGGYGSAMGIGGGGGGAGVPGMMGVGGKTAGYNPGGAGGVAGEEVVPGTGFQTWELMDNMNQNNLKLLELQALMQNNMQSSNTKANILSADHRAKMAMIEKFSARG